MKLISRLPLAAGLAVGYVLGSAAGHARYQQITSVANGLVHHPKVEQTVFDLAAKVQASSHRLPRPVAGVVNTAATRLEDALTTPADSDAPAQQL